MSDITKKFSANWLTVGISFVTQFFQYGVALLVLPFLLSQLSDEEMGIWYIFLSISSLVSLIDFGFSPSIQRSVSFIFSGASSLLKEGYSTEIINDGINYKLLSSLLFTSKIVYRNVGIAILCVLILIGSPYLYFSLGSKFSSYILLLWFIYSLSLAFNFYFSYYLSFIKGQGLITKYNLLIIFSKSFYIVVLLVAIYLNFGLFSLILANLANILVTVILGTNIYLSNFDKEKLKSISNQENLFSIIWKNAKDTGIVSVGVFLLSQAGVFLSALFLPLGEVAQLGVVLQIFGVIVVFSRVHLYVLLPILSSKWVLNDFLYIKKGFIKAQVVGYLIFILGSTIVIFFGNDFLSIIKSNVTLPRVSVIVLYALFYFMEITHGNCCSLLATRNEVPFVRASIVSGVISIVATLILIKFNFGILSLPLALCLGSLPYNSWKWPYEVYKILKPIKNY